MGQFSYYFSESQPLGVWTFNKDKERKINWVARVCMGSNIEQTIPKEMYCGGLIVCICECVDECMYV